MAFDLTRVQHSRSRVVYSHTLSFTARTARQSRCSEIHRLLCRDLLREIESIDINHKTVKMEINGLKLGFHFHLDLSGLNPFTSGLAKNKDHYTGESSRGQSHGKGTYIRLDTDLKVLFYSGQWNQGDFQGQGTLCFEGQKNEGFFRTTIIGKWKNGNPHGFCTLTLEDSEQKNMIYTGELKDGKFDGQGRLVVNDRRDSFTYIGGWRSGSRHGRGTQVDQDGTVITSDYWGGEIQLDGTIMGDFKIHDLQGEGLRISPDGRIQKGKFRHGILEEENGENLTIGSNRSIQRSTLRDGVLQWTYLGENGTIEQGPMEERELKGQGLQVGPNGTISAGQFEEGELKGKGFRVYADGTFLAGQFEDWGLKGKGLQVEPDGTILVGQFEAGHLRGSGTAIWEKGRILTGEMSGKYLSGRGIRVLEDGSIEKGVILWGRLEGRVITLGSDNRIKIGKLALPPLTEAEKTPVGGILGRSWRIEHLVILILAICCWWMYTT